MPLPDMVQAEGMLRATVSAKEESLKSLISGSSSVRAKVMDDEKNNTDRRVRKTQLSANTLHSK